MSVCEARGRSARLSSRDHPHGGSKDLCLERSATRSARLGPRRRPAAASKWRVQSAVRSGRSREVVRRVSQKPAWTALLWGAQTLGMAFHELATNAGKYGALSVTEGRVAITWSLDGNDSGTFSTTWQERGGPPVVPPSKKGFGSMVIGRIAESSLGAKVDLEFAEPGLLWRLRCPAQNVTEER